MKALLSILGPVSVRKRMENEYRIWEVVRYATCHGEYVAIVDVDNDRNYLNPIKLDGVTISDVYTSRKLLTKAIRIFERVGDV